MLKVTIGIDKIEIRFDHKYCTLCEVEDLTGIKVDKLEACGVSEYRRYSLATVTVNNVYCSFGVAICHPIDNFRRAMGRKKALANALRAFNKADRTIIWNEYKAKCGL